MSTTKLNPLLLAKAFAAQLQASVTREQFAEILARNATPEYASACASHDFCDANMPMAAAFAATFGREPFTTIEVEGGAATEDALKADTEVWNKAWDWAKAGQFNADKIEVVADNEILELATHAALNEACRLIQDHLGVTTGDFAGVYFTGGAFGQLKQELGQYLDAQRADEERNSDPDA